MSLHRLSPSVNSLHPQGHFTPKVELPRIVRRLSHLLHKFLQIPSQLLPFLTSISRTRSEARFPGYHRVTPFLHSTTPALCPLSFVGCSLTFSLLISRYARRTPFPGFTSALPSHISIFTFSLRTVCALS